MSAARRFLDELFARAGAQDLAGVLELWHPEGTLDDITLGRSLAGKDAVSAYLEEFFAAFTDLSYSPERVITEGGRGVVMWQGQTRVAEPFFGFPATDKTIGLRGLDVFEIRDDLVWHEWSWYGDGWFAARLSSNDELVRRLMPR
ncbi:MAG: ester cyclase [Gaiellaceae bacterium]